MEKSSFFNALKVGETFDRVYKAEDFAEYFGDFITNGVYALPSIGLKVVAKEDMTIAVEIGKAFINGYRYRNTSDREFELDNADGVLNRIDRIVVRWDLKVRDIYLAVKKGMFASKAVAPALQRDSDIWELALADVAVKAGAAEIRATDITDQRQKSDLCGIVQNPLEHIDLDGIYDQFDALVKDYWAWWETQQDTTGYLTVAGENPSLQTSDKTVLGAVNEIWSTRPNNNLLINGDFQVWQRGDTFNYSSYTADRWNLFAIEASVDAEKLNNPRRIHFRARGGRFFFGQAIEWGKGARAVTLSFRAKVSKDIAFLSGPRMDRKEFKGTGEWETYKMSFVTPDADVMYIDVFSADWVLSIDVECEWAKLEYGNIATPFVSKSYAEELDLCQRYCWVIKGGGVNEADRFIGHSDGNGAFICFGAPVPMRVCPTLKTTGNLAIVNGVTAKPIIAIGWVQGGKQGGLTAYLGTGTGSLAVGGAYSLAVIKSADSIIFDAEIY